MIEYSEKVAESVYYYSHYQYLEMAVLCRIKPRELNEKYLVFLAGCHSSFFHVLRDEQISNAYREKLQEAYDFLDKYLNGLTP